jgi:hypothetical protein
MDQERVDSSAVRERMKNQKITILNSPPDRLMTMLSSKLHEKNEEIFLALKAQ